MEEKIIEEQKLKEVLEKYKEVLEDLGLVIKTLPNKYANNPELLETLLKQYENKERVITEGLNKPYFARIDFKDDKQEVQDICYIGKVGVSDFDNEIVTVDWRAPIASLYYDSNIGRASYNAPEGLINGEVRLKRQYDITNGQLISYADVDTVSNDEILKPYLSVNADNRLKNIVSSIQDEQNKIIRNNLFDNIIVQGVAGSGKTTVALHRIAYLAYNYKDKIKANQYMVIGPNKFFINYISSVLPDLDVTDVTQLTYQELVEDYLEEKLSINKDQNNALSKLKLSMDYKEIIDKYIKKLDEDEVLPKKDFEIKKYPILSKEIIEEIYKDIDETYFQDISSKVERTILMTSTYLKKKVDDYLSILNKEYYTKLNSVKTDKEKKKITKDYEEIKKELINTGLTASLRKYFNFKAKKTTTIYKNFLKSIKNYTDNETLLKQKISNNSFEESDLPALMYLNYRLQGAQKYKEYKHTVIDEAQDYGTFSFYALKQILPSSSFSIFGDLAQSIYDYKSINSWEEVVQSTFNDDCNIEYLLKSYRTTVEIMNEANIILKHLNLKTSEPVIRHGKEVNYLKIDDNYYENILKRVKLMEKNNYESIALISRTENEAKDITENLTNLGLEVQNISLNNEIYNGGICSITSELSKGLEFDAVILTDASEEKYNSNNETDMKNLYVSMTRPLHELEILYQTDLTKPLQKLKK